MRRPVRWIACPECSKNRKAEDRILVRWGEICADCYRKSLGLEPSPAYPTLADSFFDQYLN